MIDHVIVTVRSEANGFDVDMELPSKVTVEDLAPQLLENLKAIAPHQFIGIEEIKIKYGKNILNFKDTLDSSYVYDGSILEII